MARFPTSGSSVSLSKAEQDFEMFQQWMAEHGRVSPNSEKSNTRFQIFQRNLKYVTDTNAKRSNSSGAYCLGLNKFADMSPEEFKRVYLRHPEVPTTIAPATSRSGCTQQSNSCENSPSSMDWRQKGVVTPVKNQQRCGGCWAFATSGTIESVNAIRTRELVRLSEQELVDCDLTNHDCSGGFPMKAFKWVVENGGLSKDDYPYVGERGYCKAEKAFHGSIVLDAFGPVTAPPPRSFAKSVQRRKQSPQNSLQDLNRISDSSNSSDSSGISVEASRGCLRFFRSHSSSSSSKSSTSRTKYLSKTPNSILNVPPLRQPKAKENLAKGNSGKHTEASEKVQKFKKNPPCLYQRQPGNKSRSKIGQKSMSSSVLNDHCNFLPRLPSLFEESPPHILS
ncbi:cysteine protease XCP2-like [Neltuma alba]|uniref:cysteine protease XCP2-like n=1 Tax=Neltuma alba TaxID=207710 RepID=UPI0010A585BA|nr:cysteine protease XCP2-like [Prosopis alba]